MCLRVCAPGSARCPCTPTARVRVPPSHPTPSRYGLARNDAVRATGPQHDALFSALLSGELGPTHVSAGGSAQNTAKVAAWAAARAGSLPPRGFAAYVGPVGDDGVGAQLAAAALRDGVTPLHAVVRGVPTGCCAALVTPGAHRSMVARLPPSLVLPPPASLPPGAWGAIAHARVLLVVGYLLTHAESAVAATEAVAAARGRPAPSPPPVVALSLSAPFVCGPAHRRALDGLLALADVVFCNEAEAAAFGGGGGAPLPLIGGAAAGAPAPVVQAAAALATAPRMLPLAVDVPGHPPPAAAARTVVVTRGAEPTLVVRGSDSGSGGVAVAAFPVSPTVPPHAIVDATGAGDAFAGGFLAALALGLGQAGGDPPGAGELLPPPLLQRCVAEGHRAAAHVLTRRGCTL